MYPRVVQLPPGVHQLYLREAGCVFALVCLSVCPSACLLTALLRDVNEFHEVYVLSRLQGEQQSSVSRGRSVVRISETKTE